MGPRYTKAIIMLVVGSPVLAAGIIIDNSIETNKAQSSTVTIARLMIAAGACMVAIGIFICCIILTTNKKEEPNSPQHPSADVQLHRVRITTAPHTQPQQRGVQLVTYSPLPESQSVPYPPVSRFNRTQIVNSPLVQFPRNAVTNTPLIHNNSQQAITVPDGNVTHLQGTPVTQNTTQHSNAPAAQTQNSIASVVQNQRPNAPEVKRQRLFTSEAKNQRSSTSEAKSQRSSVSESKSQLSTVSEAKSQRSNVSESKSQRSNVSESKSQRSNLSESKSQRSNVSESKSQRSNVSEPKSHRSNVSESKSQRSNVSESKSQRSSTPESKSQRPNPSSAQSKRSNAPATPSHRSSTPETQNTVKHHCIATSQNIARQRSISSESLIYPVNATDMAKLLTAAKKVMDPKTFEGIAKTYSIVYSSSSSQGELATSDLPPKGQVSSCSSSMGQLSQSDAATLLLSQAKDQLGLETSVPLGNSPSAPPYQDQPPDFDPPPYCP